MHNEFEGFGMTKEEEIEWIRLFKRDSELLIVYQVPVGRKYYCEVLGIRFHPKNLKHEGGFYFVDKNDLMLEYNALNEEYRKDSTFLQNIADKMEKEGDILISRTANLALGIEEKSIKELGEIFGKSNELFYKYMPFVWIIFSIEKLFSTVLRSKIREKLSVESEEVIGEYFNTLISVPYKETAAVAEIRQILNAASLIKKNGTLNPQINKMLKNTHKEFCWAGIMRVGWTYLKDEYGFDHYVDLAKALAQGNPEKELAEIDQKSSATARNYERFVSTMPIAPEIIEIANLLKRYIFLRTYRGEVVVKTMINIRKVLEEIATRLGIELGDIVFFTPEEIIKATQNRELPFYERRKKGYKLLILDGKPRVISEVDIVQVDFDAIREIKGEGILPGLVHGRVKRILTKEDVSKLAKGEILVAQMTSPDMMPAIMKASAIITDEGGLTCHAALISRELQIPCVISTEIATRVLKDGDQVFVNSKDGTVRKE
jgi:phosphoenolpyruvate synthase/pyruvate phosphate dikinase